MASPKQVEANRLNARKSTGPRSARGKSATRLNALKHGLFATDPIIPGEDPARFEALQTSHVLHFQPVTPDEQILVAALVRHAWFLERYSTIETHMWNAEMESNPASDSSYPLAAAHAALCQDLARVQRRIDSAGRNYRRDLELVSKLQTARQKAVSVPKAISQPASPQPFTSEIGLVPANPPQLVVGPPLTHHAGAGSSNRGE